MSLLTIVSDMMGRLGKTKPANVFANADPGVQQMISLLQDIGDELAERNFWQSLNIQGKITADGETHLFPLPNGGASAFSSGFSPGFGSSSQVMFGGLSPGLKLQSTLFPMIPVVGPVTNEQMNALRAFPVAPIQPVWRIIEGYFDFYPIPALGEVYNYNFYSSNWVLTAAGNWTGRWTADTDTSLIDEKILTRGLEWRYLASKGLDYAEAFRRYEDSINRADGRQDSNREVAMSQRPVTAQSSWPGLIPLYDGSDSEGSDFGYS